MNQEHFDAWVEELRTTERPQAHRQLCVDNARCCLGIGYEMVPGYDVDVLETNTLAPRAFIDWLGVNTQHVETDGDGWDLRIDWPGDLTSRPQSPDNEGPPLFDGLESAATLNDTGFTFPQIADILAYFGVSEAYK